MSYTEQEYRSHRPKKRKRRKQHFFLNIFILILVIVGAYFVVTSSIFDVKEFYIEGDKHFTPAQIIEMTGIPKGENIFTVRVSDAEERLESDPYIKSAEVKWDLPDSIEIVIEERVEDILIETDNGVLVLNFDGTILLAGGEGRKLPRIVGLTPKDPKPGSPLSVNEADILRPCLDFFRTMIAHDLPVTKLDVRNFTPRAYIIETLYIEGSLKDMESHTDELKKVLADLLSAKEIKRGKVVVSGTGTCVFVPDDPAASQKEESELQIPPDGASEDEEAEDEEEGAAESE